MKTIFSLSFILLLLACKNNEVQKQIPSVPLLYFNFNGSAENTGIEPFSIKGSQYTNYSEGIEDSCFNLSSTALNRQAIIVETKQKLQLDNYDGFSVVAWVKPAIGSKKEYTILGNKILHEDQDLGWNISTTKDGSWQFEISDGNTSKGYQATAFRQIINDGQWHQISFVYNKNLKEIRLYYDGDNVSILSVSDLKHVKGNHNLHIGCTPHAASQSKESFYGEIDEVGIWTKVLNARQIRSAYNYYKSPSELVQKQEFKDEFKLLNWNIWNGGTERGCEAGIDKIAEVISSNSADFVTLQEAHGAGNILADKLNFYHYKRSNSLSLLSRYPIEETFDIFRDNNIGVAKIKISSKQHLYVCPIELSSTPNIRGLLMNEQSSVDTIISKEKQTRGSEAEFILNEIQQLAKKSNPNDAFIIAGNLNSGSHLDWTPENMDNKNGLVIPFPATKAFEKMAYTDAFRELFTDESQYPGVTNSPIFTEGYQDRLDYTFYKGNSIKPIEIEIINKTNSFFPSKRAALLTTFKLEN